MPFGGGLQVIAVNDRVRRQRRLGGEVEQDPAGHDPVPKHGSRAARDARGAGSVGQWPTRVDLAVEDHVRERVEVSEINVVGHHHEQFGESGRRRARKHRRLHRRDRGRALGGKRSSDER
jgi:hypothetical protein